MIIRTHVDISKLIDTNKAETISEEKEVSVESINNVSKKKHKKPVPTPIIEETVIEEVEEVKSEEEIDLSDWLKEEE